MSRRRGVKAIKIHRSQAGKASEVIILVIQCFPSAGHKMHKHAQTTYVLFRPQLSDNLNPGRFCIKMQISSFSGNMRKPSNIASIFPQNDCSLGWNSSCSQRMHTLSNLPQSPTRPTALRWGLPLHVGQPL